MANTLKASVSGVRGIVGDSFTPDVVTQYVQAFAGLTGKGGTVAVGRDTRSSGSGYLQLVAGVLSACGINVIDLGVCPTPTLLCYVRAKQLDGGVLITASHNPIAWNALKLVKAGGLFLNQTDFERLQKKLGGKSAWVAAEESGSILSEPLAVDLHMNEIVLNYDIRYVKQRRFRVAYDPGNGAGTVMTRRFLKRLGAVTFGIHDEDTGGFEREPEPTPHALSDLAELTARNKCDLGIAQDPDADRLCLIDETGNALSEELTLALAAWGFYAAGGRGDLAVNVSTSRMCCDIAEDYGYAVKLAPVGEANVLDVMHKEGCPFGGEGNGGVIFPDINPCRDSFTAALLVMDLIARTKRPLSQLAAEIDKYTMIKEKLKSAPSDYQKRIVKAFKKEEMTFSENSVDGIRLDFAEGWIHLRPSNTEPVIRLIGEAENPTLLKTWIKTVKGALQ